MAMRLTKSLAGVGAVILVGAGVLFFIQYLNEKESPEKKAEEAMRQIEKAYREDPYGGITPEETLQLFIDALKKGDTDLAAKYFVLDKQEEMRVDLDLVKEKGLLDELLVDLERTVKTKTSNEEVFFVASDEENIVKIQMIIGWNQNNKKWKIYEL